MALTEAQKKAIESSGNVIVSAGAGSGKTTVLTTRVIDKIINDHVDISQFLIVTFTNAAAKQMREKIKSALLKNHLDSLVNNVDSAHIETFDAFALYVVKKYGYLIGLPSTINNVPADVIQVKTHNIINDIFNRLYIEKNDIFLDLVKTYCFKKDEILADFVYQTYLVYSTTDDKEEYIKTYAIKHLTDEVAKDKVKNYFGFIKGELNEIKLSISCLSKEEYRNTFFEYYKGVLNSTNFHDLKLSFADLGNAPRTSNKDEDDAKIKEKLKKIRGDFNKKYLSFDEDNYYKYDVKNAQKYIPFVLNVVKELDERLFAFEKATGYFTFNEVALFASKLVREFSVVREEIKRSIKLIFIDEYQDTNNLQNDFINLISNNNVFVVGDVKQSIYLFRNANPKLFSNLYEEYKKENKAIDMNSNFRSRKEVVNKVNEVFNNIMTSKFGGAEYRVSHQLKAENARYENEGALVGQHGVVAEYYDDKTNKFTIDMVIDDIKKRIASHQKVYDRDENVIRDVTFKDFAILSYAGTSFMKYERAFRLANLPITAVYDEHLFDDNSILVMLSLLRAIKLLSHDGKLSNQEKIELKHSYVSIVRSFLYGFDDNKIYDEIINHTYRNDEVFQKLKFFAINHKDSLLEEIYLDLVNDFDLVYKSSSLLNPINAVEKINLFYERIKIMDNLNYNLDDFINYLEDLSTLNITMDSRHDEESSNSITMTTIHKSKGLQYKIVYLIELPHKPKPDYCDFVCDKELGCWLPGFAFNSTIPLEKVLLDFKNDTRFLEEKMRFLYVALTRTEDTCVMFLPLKKKPGRKEVTECLTLYDFIDASGVVFEENEYSKIDLFSSVNQVIPNIESKGIIFDRLDLDLTKSFIKENASKDLDLDVDVNKLNYGTHMHLLMEEVDFKTKNTSFIKDEIERKRIEKVLYSPLFSTVEEARIYKEYQFIDVSNAKNGVIDLLLIYKDRAVVVDYKLRHIDDEAYKNQLKVYKDFVEDKFKLNCRCYLLSLIDDVIKEVY